MPGRRVNGNTYWASTTSGSEMLRDAAYLALTSV